MSAIIALIVGFFSLCVFLIVDIIKGNPANQSRAATTVDINALKKEIIVDGTLSIDVFIEKMEIWQNDLPDNYWTEVFPSLITWLEECNNTYGIATKKGFDYYMSLDGCGSENIKLLDNIYCRGATYKPIGVDLGKMEDGEDEAIDAFSGVFDGNGFTIYNFTIEDKFAYYDHRSNGAGLLYGCGFIAALGNGGIVQNLRLSNYKINSSISSYSYYPPYNGSLIGGIVGTLVSNGSGVSPTIQNCAVDDLTINCSTTDIKRVLAVGGILGANPHIGGSISNCLVHKITFNGTGDEFDTANIGGIVGNDPSSGNTIVSVSYCVVNKSNWKYSSSGSNSYGNVRDLTAQETVHCYTSKSSGFGELGLSLNKGGGSNYDGEFDLELNDKSWPFLWYCIGDEYNNGWPYLRQFIEWDEISFDKDGDGYYDEYIYVPSSIISTIFTNYWNAQSKSSTFVIGGDSVTAAVKSGYTFKSWSKGSGYKLKATYTEETYTLNFAKPTCSGSTVNVSPSKSSLTVKYNTTITVGILYSATATTITYNFGGTQITYSLPAKYTIETYGKINTTIVKNNTKVPDLTHGSTYTVTPTIKLKSYNITFG
ncbi:MAG: hypothetical protein IJW36_02630 [Clostridia bacterium]|nr:hypothetical protein [Clostridia bacterium]